MAEFALTFNHYENWVKFSATMNAPLYKRQNIIP